MSMSGHIKQHMAKEFFAEKVSFSWKTARLDFLFYQSGEAATISRI